MKLSDAKIRNAKADSKDCKIADADVSTTFNKLTIILVES